MEKEIEKDATTVVDPATGDAVIETATVEKPVSTPVGSSGETSGSTETTTTTGIEDLRAMVETRFGQRFDNDSELIAFISDKLDTVSGYEASDAKIQEVLSEYPELLALVEDLGSGVPFRQALAANLDIDDLRAEEGDEDYADVEAAAQKRRDRAKRAKEYEERLASNMEKSADVLEQFFKDQGMGKEQADEFATRVDEAINDYIDGNITSDFLMLFRNAFNYDADIASARESGAIEGKNARIDAERQRKASATDGMPQGGSAVIVEDETPQGEEDVFTEIQRNNRRNWRNE